MSLMESLLKLSRIEGQLRALRSRLDSAELYHRAQSRRCEEIEARKAELDTRRRTTQARIANLESEAAGCDEQLEKFRHDMNSASTTKQYNAVLLELETVKAKRSKLDDATLEFMTAIEALDAEAEELTAQLAERTTVRDHAAGELAERRAEVGDRVAELESERDAAAAEVPPVERRLFEEMADIHDGEAMAPIVEISRRHREYACGACHMSIPFNLVSTLLSQTVTSAVTCGACKRILFMQDETRGALAPK